MAASSAALMVGVCVVCEFMPCSFHPEEARKIRLLLAPCGGILSMVHAAMFGCSCPSFSAWDERARGGAAPALDFRKSATGVPPLSVGKRSRLMDLGIQHAD
jgi:hypothetical protein